MDKRFCRFNYIGNARGLALLAESVRAGRSYEGEYICLTCDIDLGEYARDEGWDPIGCETVSFSGMFDGCGHVITGLVINRPEKDYQGLFGNVSGAVENIRLRGCHIVGRDFTGSVAGCLNGGTIRNASAIGNIYGSNVIGGIVGHAINGTLEGNGFQGDVVGRNHMGGISGIAWRSRIADSLNTSGNVKGRDCVGGITGSLFGGDLEDCRCTGSVNGYSSVGGITGRIENGNVLSCTAACSVSGRNMVGAVEGFACGKNVIEGCVLASNVFDGTKTNVNLDEHLLAYNFEA